MKLYFNKFSRGSRVRWMLEELGLPYECIVLDMRTGEHRDPAKNPHPLLKVPALVQDDGTVLMESHAIVVHLADAYGRVPDGAAFIPPSGQRGRFYQWCFYTQVTLEPEVYAVFRDSRLPAAEQNPALVAAARAKFATLLPPIRAELTSKPYLLGDAFSACDLLMSGLLIWAKGQGMLDDEPLLVAYAERCGARPARQRAMA